MDEEKRMQVILQCQAVEHLANVLIEIHSDKKEMLLRGHLSDMIDSTGKHSLYVMETLGDILNGVDAVDRSKDAWMDPVFDKGRELFN